MSYSLHYLVKQSRFFVKILILENRNRVPIKSKLSFVFYIRSSYICLDITKLLQTLLPRTFSECNCVKKNAAKIASTLQNRIASLLSYHRYVLNKWCSLLKMNI